MSTLIWDPLVEEDLLRRRSEIGADRYDEVWEGVYIVAPQPNDAHQDIVLGLGAALYHAVQCAGLGWVRAGVNVTDRADDWTQNYRVPDVVVFLAGTSAENRGTHWLGGPDLAIEVLSPHDQAREKIEFYSRVKVRELLLVDRAPWRLEWWRFEDESLKLRETQAPGEGAGVTSQTVPLRFELLEGEHRPPIRVSQTAGEASWTV